MTHQTRSHIFDIVLWIKRTSVTTTIFNPSSRTCRSVRPAGEPIAKGSDNNYADMLRV